MDYIWTERQIKSALKKLMNEPGWLDPHIHFRGFRKNATVRERRDLMQILVKNHGAFDNGENHIDKEYRISFDTENKDRLLPEYLHKGSVTMRSFPNKRLLLDPIMSNLPPIELLNGNLKDDFEELLERPIGHREFIIYAETSRDWRIIVKLISKLKTDDDETWDAPKYLKNPFVDKDRYQSIVRIAVELFCMYEALEIGWIEITTNCMGLIPKGHEECFLEMVKIYSCADLASRCRRIPKSVGLNSNLKRLQRLTANLPGFFSGEIDADNLEILSKDVRSLSLNESPMTSDLEDLFLTGRGYEFRKFLLQNPNPEIRNKAERWDDACLSHFEIAKRILRRGKG